MLTPQEKPQAPQAKKEEQPKKKSGGSSEKDEFPKDIPIEGEYEQFIPASAGKGRLSLSMRSCNIVCNIVCSTWAFLASMDRRDRAVSSTHWEVCPCATLHGCWTSGSSWCLEGTADVSGVWAH
jgi:hypothetical protein